MKRNPIALATAAAAGMILWTVPAVGQTRFEWPDTTVNVAAYTTIEECRAAIGRSSAFTEATRRVKTGVWSDTLPLDSLEASGSVPLPEPVAHTAQRCGARFADADSVPLEHFTRFLRLYLQAGWDDRARALIERRFAGIAPTQDVERAAVVDTVLDVLLAAPEIGARRVTLATEIAFAQIPRVANRVMRLGLYSRLTSVAANTSPDSASARARLVLERMAPIMDSLTDKELDELLSKYGVFGESVEDAGGFMERYYATLNMSLGKRTFLDSLRKSTASYVRMQRDNWARATGMRQESYKLGYPLGRPAPPIQADFWLGYDPRNGPRPALGRVSLVVFLDTQRCIGTSTSPETLGGACAGTLYPLARLEERFPELDITVVGQSSGHYAYQKDGMTPEREAQLTKQWLEGLGVDAPLAMTSTEFWRLPSPDSRRLDRPTETTVAYSFGIPRSARNTLAYLIDESGIVIHVRLLHRWAEFQDFNELIEILLQRQRDAREIVP